MDDYTQQEIDQCLECEKPTCNNCLEHGGRLRRATAHAMTVEQVEQFIEMYNNGLMLADIADALNITRSTIDGRLRRFGLPTRQKNRPELTYEILKERENAYIKTHKTAMPVIPMIER